MIGGMMFCSELIKNLKGNPQLGYLHGSRYRQREVAGKFKLIASALPDIANRQVLLVDDILDQGETLKQFSIHLAPYCPRQVFKAVLIKKEIPGFPKTNADFIGLTVSNQYVFGYGMDYRGRYRHLPEIYTIGES